MAVFAFHVVLVLFQRRRFTGTRSSASGPRYALIAAPPRICATHLLGSAILTRLLATRLEVADGQPRFPPSGPGRHAADVSRREPRERRGAGHRSLHVTLRGGVRRRRRRAVDRSDDPAAAVAHGVWRA